MTEDEEKLWEKALAGVNDMALWVVPFADVWIDFLKYVKGKKPIFEVLPDWGQDLINSLDLTDDEFTFVKGIMPKHPGRFFIAALGLFFMSIRSRFQALQEAFSTPRIEKYNLSHPWRLLQPQELSDIIWRDPEKDLPFLKAFKESCKRAGFGDGEIDKLVKSHIPLLDIGTIVKQYTTGTIEGKEYFLRMLEHGFIQQKANDIAFMNYNWPDISTLFELSRRNIIGPEELKSFTKMLGMPPGIVDKLPKLQYTIPDVSMLFELSKRDIIQPTELNDTLKMLGYAPDIIERIVPLQHRIIEPEALKTLYWRGFVQWDYVAKCLKGHGYSKTNIDHIKQLWEPTSPFTGEIPPFQDVIRMAVRDVWDAEAVRRYGLEEMYPDAVSEYADKLGYGAYWSKKYWAAHWQMPGFATARQMLFLSDKFDLTDMERMLKYADYPPGVVPAMIDAAYQPLTRVDVRRMYATGTISESELREAYERLGYNDRNAQLMTDWTIDYTKTEEKGAAQGRILTAFRNYLITEDQARNMLSDIGIDYSKVRMLLIGVRIERMLQEEAETITMIERRFIKGKLTIGQAQAELAARGYTTERITKLLTQFQYARERVEKRPTKAELRNFYKLGIIKEAEFKLELSAQGYSDKYVAWYVLAEIGAESV